MDLLEERGRNDPCWCMSGKKYKHCHGDHRPASVPGAPIPPDTDDGFYLSPTVILDHEALLKPQGPTPLVVPTGEPTSKPIEITAWERDLAIAVPGDETPMTVELLGALRVEVLDRLAKLPDTDARLDDRVVTAVVELASQTLRTLAELAGREPKPTLLWNEELDPSAFMARTLLLADHIVMADRLFDTVVREGTSADLRRHARELLQHKELISTGIVLPVPRGVAMAHESTSTLELTDRDLQDPMLVNWVRQQLIIEGPTAREALFVKAIDDLADAPDMLWLHGHAVDKKHHADPQLVGAQLLRKYDAAYDYGPWIRQVTDSAVGSLVQRTNERIATADSFGTDYVVASLFEARLLNHRGRLENQPPQAAMWADIPRLSSLDSPDLAKILKNERAVEDLRTQVRASMVTARTPSAAADAVTQLTHDLEAASRRLEKDMASQRFWQATTPGALLTAGLVIGAFGGGVPAIAVGALGALANLTPYLGGRLDKRRDAAYLFVAARKRQR